MREKMINKYQSNLLNYTNENKKPLIDSYFDVDLANEIAQLESYNKNLYRPNTYLHKWWARRCGSTFRLILKHLVEDNEKLDYYTSGGLEGKIILDPMMGGGTTLHEAIRLGANVIGADIDPIPILQARATLSDIPFELLENAFDNFCANMRKDIIQLYTTTCPKCCESTDVQFTLYGLQRKCECGEVLFVDSTILRNEPNGSKIHICPKCHSIIDNNEPCNCPDINDKPMLVEKGVMSCKICGSSYIEDYKKPFYSRYTPLVIVGKCNKHGLFYKSPTFEDIENIKLANSLRAKLDFKPIDDFIIKPGPKSNDLLRKGITSYLDLFSSRQLIYLKNAMDILPSYNPIIGLNIAMLVSTSLDFNSMLCGYKGSDKRRPGAIRHTFSHHAYSYPYTALENNPLYPRKTSGTLQMLFHSGIRRGRQWALKPTERIIKNGVPTLISIDGEIDAGNEVDNFKDLQYSSRRFLLINGSSTNLDIKSDVVDYIITDPPYFDSVQYSDLSLFFRVWLRRLVPINLQWNYDISQSAVESNGNGNGQYEKIIGEIMSECHRVLSKRNGRLIFTFHHWNPKGWAALTRSLKKANFVLINRYVVHSENPISVHISYLNALTHDAILVLAPSETGITKEWILPTAIDKNNSYNFSECCATSLGWMLNNNLNDDLIQQKWIELFNT
jgi:putative DNA methylase